MIRAVGAVMAALALTACIEQNTRWDPPAAATSTSTSSGNGTSGSGGGSTDGEDDTSSTSTSSTSSSGVDDEGMEMEACEGNWRRNCDGECRDTKNDPLACGLACTNCTDFFGPHARCKTGLCRPPGGGGGD